VAVRQSYQINEGNESYRFKALSTGQVQLKNLDPGTYSKLDLVTKDSDSTDECKYRAYALGAAGAADFARLVMGFETSGKYYEVATRKNGAGVWYPIGIGMDTDYSFIINIDKTISAKKELITESFFNLGPQEELVISGGVITPTRSIIDVATEGGAATDDLDTINNGIKSRLLIIRADSSSKTVVLKNGTGNLKLAGADFSLDHQNDRIVLIGDTNKWIELSRSDNG